MQKIGRPNECVSNFREWIRAASNGVDTENAKTCYGMYQLWCTDNGKNAMHYNSFRPLLNLEREKKRPGESGKYTLGIEEYFRMVCDYIKIMTDGHINSLIIYGSPGTGKSYTVMQALQEQKAEFFKYAGGLKTTFDLVRLLYKHRKDEIILFDDFDSVFRNRQQLDILKIGLEDKWERQVTWIDSVRRPKREKIPEQFTFTSGVIFITNRRIVDQSILSRSFNVGIYPTKKEMLKHIKNNFDTFLAKIPLDFKNEVWSFLFKNVEKIKKIDFRLFKVAVINYLIDKKTWRKRSLSCLN
jgi:Cdc6-like AAA superfamily ATPase